MTFRNIALATAALGLAATPVMAEVPAERTQPVEQSSELGFGGGNTLFYLLGVAAIVAGIILITDDDDDDAVSA